MNPQKRCLIIDDDLDDQEIFRMCLNDIYEDIECLTANDGIEALGMLQAGTEYIPDYIFLDVNMPKMNGIDCLKELKKIKYLEDTRIYMYSTTSEVKVLKDSMQMGAYDFIIKPVKVSELKGKLYKIFHEH